GGGIDVAFNEKTPGLNDVRIRKALVLATDLDQLNQEAAGGTDQMIDTFFVKGSPEYNPKAAQVTNNLAEAQQLVNQYDASHPAPTISFTVYAAGRNWGDPIVQQWSRLKGIKIVEDVESTAAAYTKLITGAFQMAFTGIAGSDPESLYQNL